MKLLALDAAFGPVAAAVFAGEARLASESFDLPHRQADRMVPLVRQVVRASGLDFPALDGIVVTIGPGSFTGVRTGLAVARGIGLAARLPVLGLTTLEALAGALSLTCGTAPPPSPDLVAAIDARRGQLYLQRFSTGMEPLTEPLMLTPDAAALLLRPGPLHLAGNGAALILPFLDGVDARCSGRAGIDLAVLAWLARRRGLPAAGAAPPEPLYLRAPDARLPQ